MKSCYIKDELASFIEAIALGITKRFIPSKHDLKQIKPILRIELEVPKKHAHGDLACNIAMKLSKLLERPPMQLANLIADEARASLRLAPLGAKISNVQVEPPGFINFFLSRLAYYDILRMIEKQRADFGKGCLGAKKKVLLEFVSANPTGPLTIAHGRQAAIGDALGNILEFAGFRVRKEYFINDEGNQIDVLAKSIYARYKELYGQPAVFPEDGYKGAYIVDIAKSIKKRYKDKFLKIAAHKAIDFFAGSGANFIMALIKKDLSDFGVVFDVWASQRRKCNRSAIKKALDELRKKGYIYDKDDAVWFNSSRFGDDKDRVVIKKDGSLTYLAADIAYHKDKYARGFDELINIWGPDHHGYIARLSAAVEAMGRPRGSLSILICQLVTLYRENKPMRMSTREGEFITLKELMDEVGRDAARFFFMMRKNQAHLDFDLELAKSKSLENPVYYIQYAHARICSILEYRRKQRLGSVKTADLALLKEDKEVAIIKTLGQFPETIELCANEKDPYALGAYLAELAGRFHSFYNEFRVVTQDPRLTKARLTLVDCVRFVLARGLCLLGISVPEKM